MAKVDIVLAVIETRSMSH